MLVHPYAPQVGFRLKDYNLSQAVGNPMDTTIAAGCIVFGGIADRHPDLKIILVHGGGFFPYQVGRFQRVYEVSPEAREHAKQPPLEYARWFYYDTMLLFPPAVRYLAELMGGARVVLGSDYPFDVGDAIPRSWSARRTSTRPRKRRCWARPAAACSGSTEPRRRLRNGAAPPPSA